MRLSLTKSVWPSALSRASTLPTPESLLTAVEPSSVSAPSDASAYRVMLSEAVSTVKRNSPSWVIPTQHGAV